MFEWTGFSVTSPSYGSGSWDGTRLYWWYDSRYVWDYYFEGKECQPARGSVASLPVWSFDGTILTNKGTSEYFRDTHVRFDGKVPLPLMLAIVLQHWTDRRVDELCGSFLW